jgi:N-acetylglutamate synthase-like GNAT family acetyltransferase
VARTKAKAGGKKVRYQHIFATREHWRIENIRQLKTGWNDNIVGFYAGRRGDWRNIGSGELRLTDTKRKYVQTDSMGLHDDAREKGHGIHLYFAMIHSAKRIGAHRIYSSRHLNEHSGNMWCNKLREFFDVRGPKDKKPCNCKCRNCRRKWGRYYIDLTKLKLRSLPL